MALAEYSDLVRVAVVAILLNQGFPSMMHRIEWGGFVVAHGHCSAQFGFHHLLDDGLSI